MKNKNPFPLMDEITTDLEGFLDTIDEPSCEDLSFKIDGTPIPPEDMK